jgi:hypothetical protein
MKKIVLLFSLISLLLVGACDKAVDDAEKAANRTAEETKNTLTKKGGDAKKDEFKEDKSGDEKEGKSVKREKDEEAGK